MKAKNKPGTLTLFLFPFRQLKGRHVVDLPNSENHDLEKWFFRLKSGAEYIWGTKLNEWQFWDALWAAAKLGRRGKECHTGQLDSRVDLVLCGQTLFIRVKNCRKWKLLGGVTDG